MSASACDNTFDLLIAMWHLGLISHNVAAKAQVLLLAQAISERGDM